MTFSVNKLTDNFGAEITGLDIAAGIAGVGPVDGLHRRHVQG